MNPAASFVDVEDAWEAQYLECALGGSASFKETADLVLDKIGQTSALSTFINSRVDKRVIDALPKLKFITTRNSEKLQLTLRNCFLLQRENVIFTPTSHFIQGEPCGE